VAHPQEGISYNSYLIDDEKKALIDLSTEQLSGALISRIESFLTYPNWILSSSPRGTGPFRRPAEPAAHRPQAVVLGTQKTREMLKNFYGITEKVRVVSDGETLTLADTSCALSQPLLCTGPRP